MSAEVDQPGDGRPGKSWWQRWWAILIAVLLVAGVAAAVVTSTRPGPGAASPPGTPSSTASAVPPTGPTAPPTDPPTSAAPSPTDTQTAPPAPPDGPTVPLGEPAEIIRALTATVAQVEAVTGEAQGPGEVAGPAVRFTVVIDNGTGAEISLANTVINAYYGEDQIPADTVSGPGASAFPSVVAPGGSASGVFVFDIPADGRALVRVTVDYSASTPVIAFEGAAPSA